MLQMAIALGESVNQENCALNWAISQVAVLRCINTVRTDLTARLTTLDANGDDLVGRLNILEAHFEAFRQAQSYNYQWHNQLLNESSQRSNLLTGFIAAQQIQIHHLIHALQILTGRVDLLEGGGGGGGGGGAAGGGGGGGAEDGDVAENGGVVINMDVDDEVAPHQADIGEEVGAAIAPHQADIGGVVFLKRKVFRLPKLSFCCAKPSVLLA